MSCLYVFLQIAVMYNRHGICSSCLRLCLTLNFIFPYYSRAGADLKITMFIFCWFLLITWPWGQGCKIFCSQNLLNLVSMEREFYADQYFLADFSWFSWFLSLFGLLTLKNASRGHGIKGEFVSLAKSMVLCNIGKRILCWSIFAIESVADFFPFWGYWLSKKWSRQHDVKGEFVSLPKRIIFGTTGKRILNVDQYLQ